MTKSLKTEALTEMLLVIESLLGDISNDSILKERLLFLKDRISTINDHLSELEAENSKLVKKVAELIKTIDRL